MDGTKPASAKKRPRAAPGRLSSAGPAAEPAAGAAEARIPRQYLPAAERRRRILVAAREVFARAGLKGARTRDLAEAAGVNQATLFEHFASKEELFAAAVLQPLAAQLEGARERYRKYEAADSPESLLELLHSGIRKHLETMVDIYPLLVQALFSDQEVGVRFYREQVQPLITAWAKPTRRVIESGIDPELLQIASFGMFFAVAMDRIVTGKTQGLAEVSRQLTQLLVFGSRQGPEPQATGQDGKPQE